MKNTATAREAAAIGVCVQSVLQTKGKTLKKFKCGKRMTLKTQKQKQKRFKGGFVGPASSAMGLQGPSQPTLSPYQSTDPTASKIQPGAGTQSYYENAVKAPVRL